MPESIPDLLLARPVDDALRNLRIALQRDRGEFRDDFTDMADKLSIINDILKSRMRMWFKTKEGGK